MNLKTLTAPVLILLTLTACVHSSNRPDTAPSPIPSDIKICINKMTEDRKGGLSKKEVFGWIAELKRSERAKTACGKRLIKMYEEFVK